MRPRGEIRDRFEADAVNELLESKRELPVIEEQLGQRSGVLEIEAEFGIGNTSLVQESLPTSPRARLPRFERSRI